MAFLPLVARHKTSIATKAFMRPAIACLLVFWFVFCWGRQSLLLDGFSSKTVHAQLLLYSKSTSDNYGTQKADVDFISVDFLNIYVSVIGPAFHKMINTNKSSCSFFFLDGYLTNFFHKKYISHSLLGLT
jgi:hypothetical protein